MKENAFLKNQDIWSKQKEIIQIWKGGGTSSQENQFLEKESYQIRNKCIDIYCYTLEMWREKITLQDYIFTAFSSKIYVM